jgi:hypothetical protein
MVQERPLWGLSHFGSVSLTIILWVEFFGISGAPRVNTPKGRLPTEADMAPGLTTSGAIKRFTASGLPDCFYRRPPSAADGRNFKGRGEFIFMFLFFSNGIGLGASIASSVLLTLVLLYACSG